MFDLDEAVTFLERTPRTLSDLLDGLPEDWLATDEGPGTFSARDVVAHLVLGEEEDWMPRLRMILDVGEQKAFEPFEREGFRERYAGLAAPELLDRFRALRGQNLAALHVLGLDEAALAQRGTHPDFGAVTLRQLLATWVVHDLAHLAQIARVMAKRYGDAVGPWRAYLGILDR